ncbi:hypothetical protein SLE2022_269150 [Rubroshorea leprosula]
MISLRWVSLSVNFLRCVLTKSGPSTWVQIDLERVLKRKRLPGRQRRGLWTNSGKHGSIFSLGLLPGKIRSGMSDEFQAKVLLWGM